MSTPIDPFTQAIGSRLRDERNRLGKSQIELGSIGGVTNKTQGLYESGVRSPDSRYLARVAAAGVDVAFVVAGQRVVFEAKKSPEGVVNEQVAAYVAPVRDADWLEVLEAVIDWLNSRGKRVPGHKVIAATDLIADYCRERGMDEDVVERTLRLVA